MVRKIILNSDYIPEVLPNQEDIDNANKTKAQILAEQKAAKQKAKKK